LGFRRYVAAGDGVLEGAAAVGGTVARDDLPASRISCFFILL
jgi:hypothetical protein